MSEPSGDKPGLREMAPWVLGFVIAGAVAPRVVYFKGRLGGRRLAIYAVGDALLRFATKEWFFPWAREQHARFEATREELARELGREPSQEELTAKLGATG